ncbi:MAG: biopolymer transporter ExbD [Phycisphaerae bacterium]|nr:biopolymer transporter ExbD [Phycisphaerae bacterium]
MHAINVTPMIDVVMCLIVFFLIVGKLAADQRSQIRLPVSGTGVEEKAPEALVINAMPGGGEGGGGVRYVIEAQEIPAEALAGEVRERLARRPGMVVEVRASRELSYGGVGVVLSACRAAGVESVRLAAERGGGGR